MTRFSVAIAYFAGVLLVTAAALAQSPSETQPSAQQPSHDQGHASGEAAAAAPSGNVEPAPMMELEAIEAELDLLVTKMNDSQGPSKIEAMADLLATLVTQHRVACGSMMRSRGETEPAGCCNEMKRAPGGDGNGRTTPKVEPTP